HSGADAHGEVARRRLLEGLVVLLGADVAAGDGLEADQAGVHAGDVGGHGLLLALLLLGAPALLRQADVLLGSGGGVVDRQVEVGVVVGGEPVEVVGAVVDVDARERLLVLVLGAVTQSRERDHPALGVVLVVALPGAGEVLALRWFSHSDLEELLFLVLKEAVDLLYVSIGELLELLLATTDVVVGDLPVESLHVGLGVP